MSKDEHILICLAIGAAAFWAGMVYARRAQPAAQPAPEMSAMDWFTNYGGGWR